MSLTETDQKITRVHHGLSLLIVCLTGVSLFGILWRVVDHYAVNVLYWDQWDMAGPMFRGEGLLAEFRYQHGPHRLGLGGLFTHAIYILSGWNVRTESFAILLLVGAAAVLALLLYRQLLGQVTAYAAVIPAAMLSLTAFEVYASGPNPSHGAVPLFLAVLLCWAIATADSWVRALSIVILTLFIVHTGFGALYGPLMIALGLSELIFTRPFSRRKLVTFVGLCLAVGVFFFGYIKNDASGCSPDTVPTLDEYLRFGFLLLTKTLGNSINTAPTVYYLGVPVLLLWIVAGVQASIWGLKEIRNNRPSLGVIAALLISYSILFVCMSSLGRTCAGVFYGGSSRYQIHLAPAYLGLSLILGRGTERLSIRLLQLLIFTLLLWGGVRALQLDEFGLQAPRTVRLQAKNCLLKYRDADYCFQHLPNFLYPVPHRVQMAERLKWMEVHNLSLYSDDPKTSSNP